MQEQFLMGNQAMAYAAYVSGVNVAAGYPGTPSTEILETLTKIKDPDVYVEWSTNEKAALEVAAGASMAGARTLVTMKQVGLNVASDPLMSLAYLGVKGGMVIIVADDPGPISSQTEQDTRTFGQFSKVPVLDPSSPEEAFELVCKAFELSEEYETPVFVRPTTRVCHGYAQISLPDKKAHAIEGFEKDTRWVIFPALSYRAHGAIEKRNAQLSHKFSQSRLNKSEGAGTLGIITSGIAYAYVKEVLNTTKLHARVLKITTPFPFPDDLVAQFLESVENVIVFEELDPFIERNVLRVKGENNGVTPIRGKLSGDVEHAGELSQEKIADVLAKLTQGESRESETPNELELAEPLPVRPPSLCAGCPHRGSFYIVKQATKGKKAVFSGDIGCYTLGNSQPLDMVDTCLCMGAGITMAQGLHRAEPDAYNIAFIGDSTFFASGLTGLVNAVYNQTDITVIVVDNGTTAMTGGQPHPGTARTLMGEQSPHIDIKEVAKALGVSFVGSANPFDIEGSTQIVREALDTQGVSVVVFEAPCIQLFKSTKRVNVDLDVCTHCMRCITQIGCPAITLKDDAINIDQNLCNGCGICMQICTFGALAYRDDVRGGAR